MDNRQALEALKGDRLNYDAGTAQADVVKLVKRLMRKGHSIDGIQQCLREVADEFND